MYFQCSKFGTSGNRFGTSSVKNILLWENFGKGIGSFEENNVNMMNMQFPVHSQPSMMGIGAIGKEFNLNSVPDDFDRRQNLQNMNSISDCYAEDLFRPGADFIKICHGYLGEDLGKWITSAKGLGIQTAAELMNNFADANAIQGTHSLT